MIRTVTFGRPSGTSRIEMILTEILNPLLTSHDIMAAAAAAAAAATSVMQHFKARAKTKTDSLQNCNKSNLVHDLKKIAVQTYLLTYLLIRGTYVCIDLYSVLSAIKAIKALWMS